VSGCGSVRTFRPVPGRGCPARSAGVGFLPVLAGQHHFGPIAAGALVSLLAATAAVRQPVAGRRIDDGRLPPAAAAAALAVCAAGFLLALTGLPGLIAGAILIGAGVATATPAGFARLAATTPPGQLGRTMGTAEAGRELGDAGGPLLVGAFGLISLTRGLGALAAALLLACAALAAPRNRTSLPPSAHPSAGPPHPIPHIRGETGPNGHPTDYRHRPGAAGPR
jgi:DHA1 family tetracycline resistance protein-like MFS transporter